MRRTALTAMVVVLAALVSSVGLENSVVRSQSGLPNPRTVTVANGSNPGEAVVSWQAVPGAAFYRVGWMANPDYEAALASPSGFFLSAFRYSNIMSEGLTSHTVTRLTPGVEYWFVVGSHDAFYGAPQWAPWTRFTLSAAAPGGQMCPPTGGSTPGGCPTIESAELRMSELKYQAIDAGENHTCGIKIDNTIECWGDNTHGQTNAPAGQFLSVSAGGVASCGINFDDNLVCWGHVRMQSPPAGDYTQVSVGDEHACAITVAAKDDHQRDVNRVVCWGLPSNDGRTANLVSGRDRPWVYIGAGSDYNCAAASNTRVRDIRCWGSNHSDYYFNSYSDVRAISAGNQHRCVLNEDGAVNCSGNDVHGQTAGQPSAQDEGSPADFYTYSAVSAGGRHSCGLRTTGNIRCWGDNLRGQASPPGANDELQANLQGVGDFTALSAGAAHTCGLREDGTAVCWGYNPHGQADPP